MYQHTIRHGKWFNLNTLDVPAGWWTCRMDFTAPQPAQKSRSSSSVVSRWMFRTKAVVCCTPPGERGEAAPPSRGEPGPAAGTAVARPGAGAAASAHSRTSVVVYWSLAELRQVQIQIGTCNRLCR